MSSSENPGHHEGRHTRPVQFREDVGSASGRPHGTTRGRHASTGHRTRRRGRSRALGMRPRSAHRRGPVGGADGRRLRGNRPGRRQPRTTGPGLPTRPHRRPTDRNIRHVRLGRRKRQLRLRRPGHRHLLRDDEDPPHAPLRHRTTTRGHHHGAHRPGCVPRPTRREAPCGSSMDSRFLRAICLRNSPS